MNKYIVLWLILVISWISMPSSFAQAPASARTQNLTVRNESYEHALRSFGKKTLGIRAINGWTLRAVNRCQVLSAETLAYKGDVVRVELDEKNEVIGFDVISRRGKKVIEERNDQAVTTANTVVSPSVVLDIPVPAVASLQAELVAAQSAEAQATAEKKSLAVQNATLATKNATLSKENTVLHKTVKEQEAKIKELSDSLAVLRSKAVKEPAPAETARPIVPTVSKKERVRWIMWTSGSIGALILFVVGALIYRATRKNLPQTASPQPRPENTPPPAQKQREPVMMKVVGKGPEIRPQRANESDEEYLKEVQTRYFPNTPLFKIPPPYLTAEQRRLLREDPRKIA